jgi:hypothetical protein
MGAEFTQVVTHRLCIVQVIAATAKWGLFMNTNPLQSVKCCSIGRTWMMVKLLKEKNRDA